MKLNKSKLLLLTMLLVVFIARPNVISLAEGGFVFSAGGSESESETTTPTSHVKWVRGDIKSDATCTNAAVYYCDCEYCKTVGNEQKKTNTVGSALGHSFGSWTCDNTNIDSGKHVRVCSRKGCGEKESENHSPVAIGIGDNNYHGFKCTVCDTKLATRVGDSRRNHTYDDSSDLHICTQCKEQNTMSRHHGFGLQSKCINGDCSAVLTLSIKTDPGINKLGTLPQYYPRCKAIKWTEPTPNGKLVITTNLKPYDSDQSDTLTKISLIAGTYEHKCHTEHQNPGAYDAYANSQQYSNNTAEQIDRDHEQNVNGFWDTFYQNVETIMTYAPGLPSSVLEFEVQQAADDLWSSINGSEAYRSDAWRQIDVSKIGVATGNQDEVDLDGPLGSWTYYSKDVGKATGEIPMTGTDKEFSVSVSLGPHAYFEGIKFGTYLLRPWGEDRLSCPGHGGSSPQVPGFVSLGYRDTNGNLIQGAPNDNMDYIPNVYGGVTRNYTCDYKPLNNLGWRYVGYIQYSELMLNQAYVMNTVNVGSDGKVVMYGDTPYQNGKKTSQTRILNALPMRQVDENGKEIVAGFTVGSVNVLKQFGYRSKESVNATVNLNFGDRSHYIIWVFEPVKVEVKHNLLAEGYTKVEQELINTNLNTYYYLPFTISAKWHGYEEGNGVHNHLSYCTGVDETVREGQVLTHKNKSLNKYLYPAYVLDDYKISTNLDSIKEYKGSDKAKDETYDTKTYIMRKISQNESYDVDKHTTEYDEADDSNKIQKFIKVTSSIETEGWDKLHKNDSLVGKIPDINLDFDYSLLVIKVNNILMKSSSDADKVDNTLNSTYVKIPAQLALDKPDSTFITLRNTRNITGLQSLNVAKAPEGGHTYYSYPRPSSSKYKYQVYKDGDDELSPMLYTYGLRTINSNGKVERTIIEPKEYGKMNDELKGLNYFMFDGKRDIERNKNTGESTESLITQTLETKELELNWYYFEQVHLDVEFRDVRDGKMLHKSLPPMAFDGNNPIAGDFIYDLSYGKFAYKFCTLDVTSTQYLETKQGIVPGSESWIDGTTPKEEGKYKKTVSVDYTGKNRRLIVWYEKQGNKIDIEYYNIKDQLVAESTYSSIDVSKMALLREKETVYTMQDTYSADARVREFENLGYLYNVGETEGIKNVGYIVYQKDDSGAYNIVSVDQKSSFVLEEITGKEYLIRFFYREDPNKPVNLIVEYRRTDTPTKDMISSTKYRALHFSEQQQVFTEERRNIQYYDYTGFVLFNEIVDDNAKFSMFSPSDLKTQINQDTSITACDITNNGNNRLLIFWYTPKPGATPEQLGVFGTQAPIEGEFYTEVKLRSNDRDAGEQYDVDGKSIPTSEDLYGNVITSSYVLEDYATSVRVKPDKFTVYFILRYRDNANDENEQYRIAVKQVDLDFDYFYLSGINTILKPIHHAIIKNEAVRSWTKNTSADWLFNTSPTEGKSNGEEIDEEVWLYPNWDMNAFEIDYKQGGKLTIENEKPDNDVVTDILNIVKNQGKTIDITVPERNGHNSDYRIAYLLDSGIQNIVWHPEIGNGTYSFAFVIDRDEVYATEDGKGTADAQAVDTLNDFYHSEVENNIRDFLDENHVMVQTDTLTIYSPDNPRGGEGDKLYRGNKIKLSSDNVDYPYLDYLEGETDDDKAFVYRPTTTSVDRLFFNRNIYVDKDTANDNGYKTFADVYFKRFLAIGPLTANGMEMVGTHTVVEDQALEEEPSQDFKNQKGNDINVHTPVINNSLLIPGNFVNQKYKIEERDNFAYLQLDGTFTVEFPWAGTHSAYGERQYTRQARKADSVNTGNNTKPGLGNDNSNWAGLLDVRAPFDTYLHLDEKTNILIRANNWVSDELFRYKADNELSMEQIKKFYTEVADDEENARTRFVFTIPVWVAERAYTVQNHTALETRVIAENAFTYEKSTEYAKLENFLKLVGEDSSTEYMPKPTEEMQEVFNYIGTSIWKRTGNRISDDIEDSRVDSTHHENTAKEAYISYNTHDVEVIGKIYDLEVIEITDPDWQDPQGGSEEEIGLRRNGGRGQKVNADAFPAGTNTSGVEDANRQEPQNSNRQYRLAPKLGYAYSFAFKTKGRKSNRIDVNVASDGFRFVPKAGANGESLPQVVDLYYKPSSGSKYIKIGSEEDKAKLLVAINDRYLKVPEQEKESSKKIYPLEKLSPLVPDNVPYNYNNKVEIGKFSGLSLSHYFRLVYDNFNEYISLNGKLGLYKKETKELVAKDAGKTKDSYLSLKEKIYFDSPTDYVVGSVGHWYVEYTLPVTTVAVPRGWNPNTNPDMILKGGYIVVTFDIKSQLDATKNGDGTTKYDYLIYTGPETNVEFDDDGNLPQEEVLIEWPYVEEEPQGGSEEEIGETRRGTSDPITSSDTKEQSNPAYMKARETGYNGELAGKDEQLNAVTSSVASAENTMDRIYNEENNERLIHIKGTDTYLNKNIITSEERRKIEKVQYDSAVSGGKLVAKKNVSNGKNISGQVENAKDLYETGYYIEAYMPDGTKTYLPANAAGTYETDYTSLKDSDVVNAQ